LITSLIVLVFGMLTAVHFNNQLALSAGKISKVAAYRKLSHEFVAVQSAVSQFHPKSTFSVIV